MWRVRVSDACMRSGSCLGLAPAVFAAGADGRSRPRAERVPPGDEVRDAAASCPAEAITIEDLDTGEPVEP
jgi:ferredoxin